MDAPRYLPIVILPLDLLPLDLLLLDLLPLDLLPLDPLPLGAFSVPGDVAPLDILPPHRVVYDLDYIKNSKTIPTVHLYHSTSSFLYDLRVDPG